MQGMKTSGTVQDRRRKKKQKTVEVIVPTAMVVVVKVTKEFEPIRGKVGRFCFFFPGKFSGTLVRKRNRR